MLNAKTIVLTDTPELSQIGLHALSMGRELDCDLSDREVCFYELKKSEEGMTFHCLVNNKIEAEVSANFVVFLVNREICEQEISLMRSRLQGEPYVLGIGFADKNESLDAYMTAELFGNESLVFDVVCCVSSVFDVSKYPIPASEALKDLRHCDYLGYRSKAVISKDELIADLRSYAAMRPKEFSGIVTLISHECVREDQVFTDSEMFCLYVAINKFEGKFLFSSKATELAKQHPDMSEDTHKIVFLTFSKKGIKYHRCTSHELNKDDGMTDEGEPGVDFLQGLSFMRRKVDD